jgi:hypothetical protein
MNRLKLICVVIFQLLGQVCLLPKSIAIAIRQRRQWTAQDKLEAERLDRIRNPDKYLGHD